MAFPLMPIPLLMGGKEPWVIEMSTGRWYRLAASQRSYVFGFGYTGVNPETHPGSINPTSFPPTPSFQTGRLTFQYNENTNTGVWTSIQMELIVTGAGTPPEGDWSQMVITGPNGVFTFLKADAAISTTEVRRRYLWTLTEWVVVFGVSQDVTAEFS